jgi:hypothetical protein
VRPGPAQVPALEVGTGRFDRRREAATGPQRPREPPQRGPDAGTSHRPRPERVADDGSDRSPATPEHGRHDPVPRLLHGPPAGVAVGRGVVVHDEVGHEGEPPVGGGQVEGHPLLLAPKNTTSSNPPTPRKAERRTTAPQAKNPSTQPGMARIMSVDQVTWVRVGARMPRVARRSSMNTVPIAAAATTRATFSVATVTST